MAGDDSDPQVLMSTAIRVRSCLGLAWQDVEGDCSPQGLARMCTRTRSSFLHDAWTERLQHEFARDAGIEFVNIRGSKQLVHERWKMRFKKARPGSLLVASNRTVQSQAWIQRPFPVFPRQIPLGFVYRPDRFWGRIELSGVAWQIGEDVAWFMPVEQMKGDVPQTVTGVPTIIRKPAMRVRDQALKERQSELFADEGGMFDDSDRGGATG